MSDEPTTQPEAEQPEAAPTLEESFDAALDEGERLADLREGREHPEPAPEPEAPDYSALVDTHLEMRQAGEANFTMPTPSELGDIDVTDPKQIRERLLEMQGELDADDQVRAAFSSAQEQTAEREIANEAAFHGSMALLEAGTTTATELWDQASYLEENHPEVLQPFLAEWSSIDPGAATAWGTLAPEPAPPPDFAAWQREMEAIEVAQEVEKIDAAMAARLEEYANDPRGQQLLPSVLEKLQRLQSSSAAFVPSTPEEAVEFITEAFRLEDRALSAAKDADWVAQHLGPMETQLDLEERMRQEELTGEMPNAPGQEEIKQRLYAERFSNLAGTNGEGIRARPQSTAEANADFAAQLDAMLERHAPPEPTAAAIAHSEEMQKQRLERRNKNRMSWG